VKVGQKVYPISEYRWSYNVYNNFTYLKNRYNAEQSNGRWRVTAAVYSPTQVTAAPSPNPWLQLARRLLPGPTPAYACASYTVPSVYVQGFITVDITEVSCEYQCRYYNYPDSRSCYNTCYAQVEVPLTDNFVTTDKTSNPDPVQRDYQDMNPSASEVGNFASVPRLVK